MIIALTSITPHESIHYNETLVSAAATFEAGFLTLGNTQNLYFCIWYMNISPTTIVWVANRDTPIYNKTPVFKFTDGGNPVILDASGITVWSSNASKTSVEAVLLLLDTGNLVVRDGSSTESNIVWQSFDYPGDTLLPGMTLHVNRDSGVYNSLISWKNSSDPERGDFAYHLDGHGFPQLVITKGSTLLYRLGSWNGVFFSGIPVGTLYRTMQRFLWSSQRETWQLFQDGPADRCDNYGLCGANSDCNINNDPPCECLAGFTPKFPAIWDSIDWNDGCVRKVNLACDDSDGFLNYTGMKLPDTSSSWFDKNMSLQECEKQCLKNCNCSAYSNLDIRDGGSGCMIWFNDIMDMRKESSQGQEIYIRLAASELSNASNNANKKRLAGILVGIGTFILGMTTVGYVIYIRRRKLLKSDKDTIVKKEDNEKENIELPIFDFPTIANATDNFSQCNILGEGGYGPVYKAWKLWNEDRQLEFIDDSIGDSIIDVEALRCIQMGLLCVQERPDDRPDMSSVALMLNGERVLPNPKQPGFYPHQLAPSSNKSEQFSENEMEISLLEPR
ncbi:unnamed protein product [Lupinus luteus]|uniref:Uncharacterized protein n=1 Tax=Lupinus luteus TaxID=3873 RepID=A0AAV1W444_LUPLU